MLWVYGNYKYLNSFSAGTMFIRQDFYRRQILTYKESSCAEKVNILHICKKKIHPGWIVTIIYDVILMITLLKLKSHKIKSFKKNSKIISVYDKINFKNLSFTALLVWRVTYITL